MAFSFSSSFWLKDMWPCRFFYMVAIPKKFLLTRATLRKELFIQTCCHLILGLGNGTRYLLCTQSFSLISVSLSRLATSWVDSFLVSNFTSVLNCLFCFALKRMLQYIWRLMTKLLRLSLQHIVYIDANWFLEILT